MVISNFRENHQLYAGYVLECIRNKLLNSPDAEYWKDLLANLSVFEVSIDLTTKKDYDPICIVADNLISRGVPTIPPLFVEEYLADTFQLANKFASDKTGDIKFNLTENEENLIDHIKRAFHIVDPRINPQDEFNVNVASWEKPTESKYEEEFLYRMLPSIVGDHIAQLAETQRSIRSILKYTLAKQRRVDSYLGLNANDFYNQSIDFTLNFPASPGFKQGLAVEIDGSQHESKSQTFVDEMRDKALEKLGWESTVRICTQEFNSVPKEKTDAIRAYCEHPYEVHIEKNYNDPLWESSIGLNALQVALTPIGIARIQKVLTTSILNRVLELGEKKWNIAVIERDVPCAHLALLDLKELFHNLFKLEGKARKLPEIELRVYNTKEFEGCKISKNFVYESYTDNIKIFDADLIIDISVLQRRGMSGPTEEFLKCVKSANYVVVRSSHSIRERRRIHSGSPIKYNLKDEKATSGLKYFLQNIFRKLEFREGQIEILKRTLGQKNVIALLPTGAGKSLTYQLSALLQPGIVLVVDPLKSLMRDQNDNLINTGIDSTVFINSTLNPEEREARTDEMTKGQYKFIFISPERLQIDEFRKKLLNMPERDSFFSYCVVDEAHCVSEWGHDFRTSYLRLGANARKYCHRYDKSIVPIMALTGTASFDVLSDVQRELEIEDDKAIISPAKYARDELKFDIQHVGAVENENNGHFHLMHEVAELKQKRLNRLLREIPSNEWGNNITYHSVSEFFDTKRVYTNAGIVFCPHVSEKTGFGVLSISPNIQEDIQELRGLTNIYAGSIEDENADMILEETQRRFKNNELALLVATKAFGMGIDKANLRFTVHFNMPQSIESFYQEAGRAGRDRDLAYCYILYSTTKEDENTLDKNLMLSFHQNSFPGVEKEEQVLIDLLDEIKFPYLKRVDKLSETISTNLEKEVRMNLWQKKGNRLYVNTPNYPESYGYIDLNTHNVYAEHRQTHKIGSEESSIKMLKEVFEVVQKIKPKDSNLITWIEHIERRRPEPGIEHLLSTMRSGDFKRFALGFTNDIIQKITEYLSDKDDAWSEDLVEKASEYCFHHDDFIHKLISAVKSKAKKFRRLKNHEILNDEDREFISDNFYRIRNQNDTFKAIYRLSILGVIEDYDIDYRGKLINIKITKKENDDYLNHLHKYVSRYVSREDAVRVFNEVPEIQRKTVLRKCISYLIDFVYKHIAAKRKEAIDVMDSAINDGIEDNQYFIERVNSYFDSKYTEDLRRELKENLDIKTVWKYMNITKGERDPMNHLRGSCDRLLVETPDNPVLLLLRSFCRFLLPVADKSAAIRDFKVGWQRLRDLKKWTRLEYLDKLSEFYDLCVKYDNRTRQYLEPEIAEEHVSWLNKFNQSFAEGVYHG